VQPHQFRKTREVGDLDEVGRVMLGREDPTDMAIQEAFLAGRMNVVDGVGMQMVMPVLGGPPQDTALGRALSQRGEHELGDAAGCVGAVGKVSMVPGSDGEDSQPVKPDTDRNRLPRDPGPDGADARQMHEYERYCGRIDDVVVLAVGVARRIRLVVSHLDRTSFLKKELP
jgi:hypothetical protein